jgi:hypothetical protein
LAFYLVLVFGVSLPALCSSGVKLGLVRFRLFLVLIKVVMAYNKDPATRHSSRVRWDRERV